MMGAQYYKYAVASGFVIMLMGCADSLSDSNNNGEDSKQADICYYNAYIDNGPATRTSMGELSDGKYPVLWSEGDNVLFGSSGSGGDALELIEGAGTTKAVFRGMTWSDIGGVGYITGIYPANGAKYNNKYSGSITFDDKSAAYKYNITLTAVLPNVQTYQAGTFAPNVLPMIGLSENKVDLYFENYGGVLQLPVKGNGKISKIILTGNDGETLAGEFNVNCYFYEWTRSKGGWYLPSAERYWTVDYREGEITADESEVACGRLITPVSGNSTGIITVDCGKDGLTLDPTTPTMINIAMLPKTFKKGFSVKFVDYDNGGSFVKTTSSTITVKRSYVKTMEEFDYQTPEPLEPANCYVVDKAGYFMIPAFCMGNRPKSARLNVDENGINGQTGNPVAADYLWTDVSGAVSDIEYIPGKDGYISFKVNADKSGNAPRGNTVIALYDSVTKEILWSWHIWMSEYNEVKTNGSCRAGESTIDGFISESSKKSLIIMDRNLGAVSADKNDGWKTYGLYYQMGRKDPFIGANTAGGEDENLGKYTDKSHLDSNLGTYNRFETAAFGEKTNHTEWNTNLTTGWTYKNEFITAIYGYQHPMDFASSWYEADDTRWTNKELNQTEPFVSNGKHEDFWNRSKTINDPCPAGWTMLGENGKLYQEPTSQMQYFSDGVYGIEAVYTSKDDGSSSTVWWPASGFRSVDGTLGELGLGGYYWWFDHIDASHGGHGSYFYKEEKKEDIYYKDGSGVMTNHACSVRCVKARQTA